MSADAIHFLPWKHLPPYWKGCISIDPVLCIIIILYLLKEQEQALKLVNIGNLCSLSIFWAQYKKNEGMTLCALLLWSWFWRFWWSFFFQLTTAISLNVYLFNISESLLTCCNATPHWHSSTLSTWNNTKQDGVRTATPEKNRQSVERSAKFTRLWNVASVLFPVFGTKRFWRFLKVVWTDSNQKWNVHYICHFRSFSIHRNCQQV